MAGPIPLEPIEAKQLVYAAYSGDPTQTFSIEYHFCTYDFDKSEVKISYEDLTGDGLLEMIVNLGSESKVFFTDTLGNGLQVHEMEYDWFMENETMG